ncbi:hypothetical protein ACP70R_021533 [Stipagrostis hirtigluma subsp. patula]
MPTHASALPESMLSPSPFNRRPAADLCPRWRPNQHRHGASQPEMLARTSSACTAPCTRPPRTLSRRRARAHRRWTPLL